jgi:hypothetical protein
MSFHTVFNTVMYNMFCLHAVGDVPVGFPLQASKYDSVPGFTQIHLVHVNTNMAPGQNQVNICRILVPMSWRHTSDAVSFELS